MNSALEPTVGTVELFDWFPRKKHGVQNKRWYEPPKFKVPSGRKVTIRETMTPGWYARNGNYYVKFGEDTALCHYICSHRYNSYEERVFVLTLSPEHAYIGAAMLYADNFTTRAMDFDIPGKSMPGYPGIPKAKESIRNWIVNPFCETFSADKNSYDPGYPAGLPLKESVNTIYAGFLDRPPTGVAAEDRVYLEFCKTMAEFISSPMVHAMRTGKTRKIGCGMARDLETILDFRGGNVDTGAFLRARERLSTGPVCVACLPKVGALKSDGTMRKVFPMSPTLQIILEDIVGKREPTYEGITIVKGAKFPRLRYTYDIKGADKVIGPYFRRWLGAHRPELIQVFFPPVCLPGGAVGYSEQFLSGLLGTSYIVEAFTAAVARSCTTAHCYIQGDGIMCSTPISSPLLRQCEPYTINGFFYGNGTAEYVNGPLRLSSPRLLNRGKLSGIPGWQFRYEIYLRFLNARNLPKVKRTYKRWSDGDLLRLAFSKKMCVRKLAAMGYTNHYVRTEAHWDYVETTPEFYSVSKIPFLTSCFKPLLQLGAIRPECPAQIGVHAVDCGTSLSRADWICGTGGQDYASCAVLREEFGLPRHDVPGEPPDGSESTG